MQDIQRKDWEPEARLIVRVHLERAEIVGNVAGLQAARKAVAA